MFWRSKVSESKVCSIFTYGCVKIKKYSYSSIYTGKNGIFSLVVELLAKLCYLFELSKFIFIQ